LSASENKRFRHSVRYAGNATTRYALRQAQDRLGWTYSSLRQLLAIAASPESRIKNVKIEILLLLTALLRKLNRYLGLSVYLETLSDAGLLFFQQTY
jgi:hypothetical protein